MQLTYNVRRNAIMRKVILIGTVVIVGLASLFALSRRHYSNPWKMRVKVSHGSSKAEARYSWEYLGKPMLDVVDPVCKQYEMQVITIDGKDHIWLKEYGNLLVDLALDGYWLRGIVQSRKTELRPGAVIILTR